MAYSSPYQLGPWNINQNFSYSHNYVAAPLSKNKNAERKQFLPKIQQMPENKQIGVKTRQRILRQNESFRVNPCQLSFSNRYSSFSNDRKQRMPSYDPPLISFYNKNHPKLKRREQATNRSNGFDQRQQHFRSIEIKSLSRIDLMAGFLRSSQGYSALLSKPHDKKQLLLSSKRSLSQLLKYLKDPNEKNRQPASLPNGQHEFTRYTQIQQNLIKSYLNKQVKQ